MSVALFKALVFVGMVFALNVEAHQHMLDVLKPYIHKIVKETQKNIEANSVSSKENIRDLRKNLDTVWDSIQKKGFSETMGKDSDRRPSYVVMQGIIEKALTQALRDGKIKKVEAFIITPRMPSPLLQEKGETLYHLDVSDPKAFALYRLPILSNYLEAGGILNSIYSEKAQTNGSVTERELATYKERVKKYPKLHDYPIIKDDTKDFPIPTTGAIYIIDDKGVITIQSSQITQINNSVEQMWAIRFGRASQAHYAKIKKYIEEKGRVDINSIRERNKFTEDPLNGPTGFFDGVFQD